MVYGTCVSTWVSVALRISSLKDSSSNIHGHDYIIKICCETEKLDDANLVIDQKILKQMLHDCLSDINYNYLNKVLRTDNASSELLSKYVYDCMLERLAKHNSRVALTRAEVCTPIGDCSYYVELKKRENR